MLTCKHFPSGYLRINAAEIVITSARVSGVQDFIVFMNLTSAFHLNIVVFVFCLFSSWMEATENVSRVRLISDK